MSKISNLLGSSSIGNTLSTVNTNYLNLETEVLSIQSDIENYWNPIKNYYLNFGDFLNQTTTIAQTYSAVINNTCTTVQANSSSWIKPITIFYPSIFPDYLTSDLILDTLENWIPTYFPESSLIYNENTNTEDAVPNYVEGQQLIIHAHRWGYGTSISENTFLNDYTLCQTADKTICVTCTNYYSGYVHCSNGDFNCNGQSNSCQQCSTVRCSFLSPPYNSYVPPPVRTLQSVDHYSTVRERTVTPVYSRRGNKIISYIKKTIAKAIRWTTTQWVVTANPSPNGHNSYGSISANVEMTFQDRSENPDIISIVFKIKNCAWTFDKYL
jgi:hypothetical protein